MDLGKSRTEWIEQYLLGKLSRDEQDHFEGQLATDKRLSAEVRELRIILSGISQHARETEWVRQMHRDLKGQGRLKGYSNYRGK